MQGIYKIENINTGKIYIGSSKDIDTRWKEHKYRLKNNIHHSSKLQRSYNKTEDKNIFILKIIEEVECKDNLLEREQYYIDKFDSFKNGYNCIGDLNNNKHTEKYKNKLIKNQITNKEFDRFIEIHSKYEEHIQIGSVLLERLLNKYYSHSVYTNTIEMIEYFLKYYDNKIHIAEIDISSNRQYYLIIKDKKNNPFICYNLNKHEFIISKSDTNAYLQYLKNKNLYNLNIHNIIN